MVSNYTISGEWDVLYLGPMRMPGVARVEIMVPSSLDVQKPRGGKKATVQDKGAMPATLNIELELLPDELPELVKALNILRPRSATAEQPELGIAHPQCALFGIGSVKIADIEAPMPVSGGSYVLRIKAIEHVKTPKAVKKSPPKARTDENYGAQIHDAQRALREPPSKTGAALENFTSADQPIGSGF